MLRLKNDPGLRAQITEKATQYAQKNTWDACKHEYLNLVDTFTVARKR